MEHITIPLLPSPKHRQTVSVVINQSIYQSIRLIDSQKAPPQHHSVSYTRSEAVHLAGLGGRAIGRFTELEQTPLLCFSLYYPWTHIVASALDRRKLSVSNRRPASSKK
jgi:hypothetical protein